MTVTITITGEDTGRAIAELQNLAGTIKFVNLTRTVDATETVTEAKPETEKKPRKAKEEKVAEVKEVKEGVLPPETEKPKYTLQDAIDRAREIAGDGKDEKIMNALKGINTRLGISKVREIPPEKLDGYMVELEREFPKGAASETTANMFD